MGLLSTMLWIWLGFGVFNLYMLYTMVDTLEDEDDMPDLDDLEEIGGMPTLYIAFFLLGPLALSYFIYLSFGND